MNLFYWIPLAICIIYTTYILIKENATWNDIKQASRHSIFWINIAVMLAIPLLAVLSILVNELWLKKENQ